MAEGSPVISDEELQLTFVSDQFRGLNTILYIKILIMK